MSICACTHQNCPSDCLCLCSSCAVAWKACFCVAQATFGRATFTFRRLNWICSLTCTYDQQTRWEYQFQQDKFFTTWCAPWNDLALIFFRPYSSLLWYVFVGTEWREGGRQLPVVSSTRNRLCKYFWAPSILLRDVLFVKRVFLHFKKF